MDKKTKVIIIGAVALSIGGYFIYRNQRKIKSFLVNNKVISTTKTTSSTNVTPIGQMPVGTIKVIDHTFYDGGEFFVYPDGTAVAGNGMPLGNYYGTPK